jgi:2-methylisocitrate lyase-like PEP mutase family enzyme
MKSQIETAARFLALHNGPEVLVLPNAWDVASFMVFARAGFKAIGTTSAGIAASLGHADGQRMSFQENLEIVERLVSHSRVPVTADFESGYSEEPEVVASQALELVQAGVAGLNIEDTPHASGTSLRPLAQQADLIRAIHESVNRAETRLFINARTDAFLLGETRERGLREAIRRGNAYVEAGANGVFVPDTGGLDKLGIRRLVVNIDAPVNVIAGAATPAVAELQDMGVARVSLGPRPMRVVLSRLRELATQIARDGTFDTLAGESISYGEVNSWFLD